jgi:2-dehydro-3-deoxyglucarate aldolase/4-hydroxy-2-oxoheptanedioate aldolase
MRGATKRALADGEVVLGTFVFEFHTTGIGRLAASAGARFVIYDTEHTGWDWQTISMLVATTRPTGAEAFVRIPVAERSAVSRALDAGATGLMVPMVGSGAQAADIVRWAKYPPDGLRGAAFNIAHDDYVSPGPDRYMREANDTVLLMPQIETVDGLEAVEEIAAVDGIDVLWVGHFDLTNSMGIPGQFEHPEYLAALDRVVAAARRQGKVCGFMAGSPEEARMLLGKGFRILAYGGDLWLYRDMLKSGLTQVQQMVAAEQRSAAGG